MQKESPQKSKAATNDAPNEPDQIHYFEGVYYLNPDSKCKSVNRHFRLLGAQLPSSYEP